MPHAKRMKRWKSSLLTIAIVICADGLATPSRQEVGGLPHKSAQGAPPHPGQVSPLALVYYLRLSRPTTHLLEVEVVASKVTEPALEFVMPAWSPGRYSIYDFAKNVQEFGVVGAQGNPLPWRKTDKQTWRVETQNSKGTVRTSYRVYANDLDATFSQFDTTHANVNGASVFMYVAGHKSDTLTLRIDAPASWKVISGFAEPVEESTFQVANYDILADTPLEISPEGSLDQFAENGKVFRVAVHGYDDQDTDRSKLLKGLQKIVRSELAMMPPPDFRQYTFIFHFAPDITQVDGMEHLNSAQILVKADLSTGTGEALEIAAHEFFHLWNVKRLRPAGLAQLDYTRENYTRSLWFAEGITSYYSYLHLLRSGIWDRKEFLKRLADEIRNFEAEPGRALMSAESSSFAAWFYDRSPQMQETNFANAAISYYNKGAILGLLLDLEIRSRTDGQKCLDDALVALYQKFYKDGAGSTDGLGPKSSSTEPEHGYEEWDILEALNTVSRSDFTQFFDRYVGGTEPLPFANALARAGLELRVTTTPGSAPILGVVTQRAEHGLKIVAVRPGTAADRAGLSRDDLLIATEGVPLEGEDLKERLKFFVPGTHVPITVERHGRQEKITVTLDPPQPDLYTIEELVTVTPAQVSIRNWWLGK